MKVLIALIAVIFIFYISCLDWKRSVKAIFAIVILEGVLRKWVLPQASEIIYFIKDIVLFGAYFQYYALSPLRKRLPSYKTPFINIFLFLSLGWSLVQVFNPSLGSPIVGIWGLKNYFYYIPLIWMLPQLFQSEEELCQFLRTQIYWFIPVGILGVIQFFSPSSSPLNFYAPGLQQASGTVALFGAAGNVRITGTFSYVNTYIPFLLFTLAISIVLLEEKQKRNQLNILLVASFLLALNSFMTGSRTIIFAGGLLLLGYLGIKAVTQFERTWRILKWLLLPISIIIGILPIMFASEIDTILNRILLTKDLRIRIIALFSEPLHNLQYKQLDGFGIGATHQATGILRQVLGLPMGEIIPVGYESEMGRILLEIGPIGFILWYGFKFAILISLFALYWKLKRRLLRNLALVAFWIQAIWFPNQHVFHITFSFYYWILTGFIYLLPQLEQAENRRQQQLLLQAYDDIPYFPDSSYGES